MIARAFMAGNPEFWHSKTSARGNSCPQDHGWDEFPVGRKPLAEGRDKGGLNRGEAGGPFLKVQLILLGSQACFLIIVGVKS